MIIGVGIDSVNIKRLIQWQNNPGILKRYFHHAELKTAKDRGNMELHSLAARFAAKEAFGKALGTGLRGFSLKEISVINDEFGKPDFNLYGKALQVFRQSGGKAIFVSLTHEHDYALASVIIEG